MPERLTRYDLDALPGGALIREGLADLAAGRQSIGTLLIDIARPRLTELGVVPRSAPPPVAEPERELYRRLRAERGDAYARYNSLIRELTSFQSALIRLDPSGLPFGVCTMKPDVTGTWERDWMCS